MLKQTKKEQVIGNFLSLRKNLYLALSTASPLSKIDNKKASFFLLGDLFTR
jgi:hypothetical protein